MLECSNLIAFALVACSTLLVIKGNIFNILTSVGGKQAFSWEVVFKLRSQSHLMVPHEKSGLNTISKMCAWLYVHAFL